MQSTTKGMLAFLVMTFGWAMAVGLVLAAFGIKLGSFAGIAVLACLYMPAPAVAALIVERRIVRERIPFPTGQDSRRLLMFFLLPVASVTSAIVLFFAATLVLGDLLHTPGVGTLVQNIAELKANIAHQYGTALANSANYPPSIMAMFLVTLLAALVAGWSINGLFALGEEYGWRGFLWERWKHLGVVKANIAIGMVWGLWHAPLILQGYNYPGHPIAGVVMMMVFTTSLAFILSAIRELTQSVLPAAATHGSMNGAAALTVVLTAGANPLVGEIVGIVGCICLLLTGAALWMVAKRSPV